MCLSPDVRAPHKPACKCELPILKALTVRLSLQFVISFTFDFTFRCQYVFLLTGVVLGELRASGLSSAVAPGVLMLLEWTRAPTAYCCYDA